MAGIIDTIKGWSNILADKNNDCEGIANTNIVIDYTAYIKALSEARAKFHDTHDSEDYKAMNTVREQYGISRDNEKTLSTILAMEENNLHKEGNVVCHIPKKEFEDMLYNGR